MRNKIKSIKEKVPQVTTLPDGYMGWLLYRCYVQI
jgi:hypothetical protein